MNRTALTYILIGSLLATACVGENPVPPVHEGSTALVGTTDLLVEGSPEAFAVLALLNAPDTSESFLHTGVGTSVYAARGVVATVRGGDGVWGSKDDNHLQTVRELDNIDGFDAADALAVLLHLDAAQAIPAAVVDGLALDATEVAEVLDAANLWTTDVLIRDANLDAATAAALIAARPVGDVETIAALPRGGKWLVAALLDAVHSAGALPNAHLVVDGVALTPAQAARVVRVANDATMLQLVREAGLEVRTAQIIEILRPFATIKELSAAKGIDTAELQTLSTYAAKWSAPAPEDFIGDDFDPTRCGELVARRDDDRVEVFHDVTQEGIWTDGPRPRTYAFQASVCASLHAPATQALVADRIWDAMETWTRDWSFEVASGGAAYLGLLEKSRDRVAQRVEGGGGSDDSGTVLSVLDDVVASLSSQVAANPGAFIEIAFQGQDGMCAERAVALIDTRDNQILVIHEPSACK